jgi:Ni,Fe-hydrogenase III large subunit/Ni,Fe-hydrogenase III component G
MSPMPLTRPDGTLELPVRREGLRAATGELLAGGHRLALVAAHDDGAAGFHVVYAFAQPGTDMRTELVVRTPREDAWIPSLASLSFAAGRFERAIRDQFGIVPEDHPRPRRLVLHDHWPRDWFPMRRDALAHPGFAPDEGSFSFVPVEGQGVYEIPVGPVHAGLIEPGHFRFSVVGETILRMKARLWYLHRGVEKMFEGRAPVEGIALAERVSGDTAVGHGLAYAMAVEGALGLEVSEEDRLVRALLLELERLHNHVADLGAIPNDVGFGIVNVHAQRLRETLLRLNAAVTGHRLLRGGITVGGSGVRALPDDGVVRRVADEVADLVRIALGNGVVMDRFRGTAVLRREEAVSMGVLGYVARASGVDIDARRDHPFVDLGAPFRVCTQEAGDVLARFVTRAEEVQVSAALVADLVRRLGGRRGTGATAEGAAPSSSSGAGEEAPSSTLRGLSLVEAWRGTACHRVELDGAGRLSRVAIVDPSFFTWPALPVALADTIVPDFPLANKSFNQSYAGNDL